VVANSLFITGANKGQETSEKKEPRKENGKRRKGNKTRRKSLYIERSNAVSAEEKPEAVQDCCMPVTKKRNDYYFEEVTEVEACRQ
jgi:hypothetical protein